MSKMILVMEEPKSCMDCVLCKCGACVVSECKKLDDNKFKKRADFCPLRPVPEKKEVCGKYPQSDGVVPSFKIGYNTCIDEILG